MFFSSHNWDSFLYQFIVGGLFFLFGIVMPVVHKDVNLARRDDRWTIGIIFTALLVFILSIIAWQLYAIK